MITNVNIKMVGGHEKRFSGVEANSFVKAFVQLTASGVSGFIIIEEKLGDKTYKSFVHVDHIVAMDVAEKEDSFSLDRMMESEEESE